MILIYNATKAIDENMKKIPVEVKKFDNKMHVLRTKMKIARQF